MALHAIPASAQPLLEDVTDAAGIDSQHPESPHAFSVGSAWFDWDGDGWLDLLIAQPLSTPLLLKNPGLAEGPFEDVTEAAGLTFKTWAAGAILTHDFTGDGVTDLILVDKLWSGTGSLVFLTGTLGGPFVWSTPTRLPSKQTFYVALTAADIDVDGDLDLLALRYPFEPAIREGDCLPPDLFENDRGVFKPVDNPFPGVVGCSLAGAFTDLDDDGDLDYFQINDFGPLVHGNTVHLNLGAGADGWPIFSEDVAPSLGLDVPVYGMGASMGDVNGDLIPDFFISSAGEDALLLGKPDGGWEDGTDAWHAGSTMGATKRKYKWGSQFLDLDNSGAEDLLVAAGGPFGAWGLAANPQQSILLVNTGSPPLLEHAKAGGLALKSNDRSFAAADYDGDGRMDVAVSDVTSMHLLHNTTPEAGHWLGIRLQSTVSNAAGLSARLIATCGGTAQFREILAGGDFGSTDDPVAHFGLATCAGPAQVEIRWPSGHVQTADNLSIDQWTTITEPAWLTLSHDALPADGTSTAQLTVDPSSAAGAVVTITSTLGTVQTTASADGGTLATITAPSEPGRAVLRVMVDGVPLLPVRRIEFTPSEPIVWTLRPSYPRQDHPMRIGARTDAVGDLDFEVSGGKVWWTTAECCGGVHAQINPTQGVDSMTVTLTVDGVPYGAPAVIPLYPRVDSVRSRFQVLPAYYASDDAEITLKVHRRDAHGDPSPFYNKGSVVIYRDDVQVMDASSSHSLDWAGKGAIVVSTTAAELGGPGKISIAVDGVLLKQTATLAAVADTDLAAAASQEQSQFRFFDRHVHADGQDHVPIVFALTDAQRQSLPLLTADQLSFEGTGCVVLPDTLTTFTWADVHQYVVKAQMGTTPGTVSVSLSIDGTETGLTASVEAVSSLVLPVETASFFLTPPDGPLAFVTELPADGQSTAKALIVPLDASQNLTGSGQTPTISLLGGTAGEPVHTGYGIYEVLVTAGVVPCVDTVTLTFEGSEATAETTITWLGPDGAVPEDTCAALLAPPEEPVADQAEPVPDQAEPAPEEAEPAPEEAEPPSEAEPAPEEERDTGPGNSTFDEDTGAPDAGTRTDPDAGSASADVQPPSPDTAEPATPSEPESTTTPTPSVDGGCQSQPGSPVPFGALIVLLACIVTLRRRPSF
ncbi:MAG: hypothetical protein ACI9WU_000109 [Myxococcota bacterium]|jgi:hypothetical protein